MWLMPVPLTAGAGTGESHQRKPKGMADPSNNIRIHRPAPLGRHVPSSDADAVPSRSLFRGYGRLARLMAVPAPSCWPATPETPPAGWPDLPAGQFKYPTKTRLTFTPGVRTHVRMTLPPRSSWHGGTLTSRWHRASRHVLRPRPCRPSGRPRPPLSLTSFRRKSAAVLPAHRSWRVERGPRPMRRFAMTTSTPDFPQPPAGATIQQTRPMPARPAGAVLSPHPTPTPVPPAAAAVGWPASGGGQPASLAPSGCCLAGSRAPNDPSCCRP